MASTYTNDLRLELIATGEAAATWGDKTNTNLTNIAAAFGYATQDGFSANADSTTTVADGAADPARAMYFKVTSSATLTATRTLTIAPNTISRVMWIENATTGGQSIAISQGTGANVTIATGKTAVVYLDGAGSGAAVVDAMAGVDPGVTDTLAEVLSAGNTTTTDQKIQFRDSAIYINSSADGQLDIVADNEVQIAATTIDINGAINASGEIIAASLDISGNIDVDGTTNLDVVDIDGAVDFASTTAHAGNATFADNAKAIFGTGGDGLEIYHDGSHSYISDTGTGYLRILASDYLQLMSSSSEVYINAAANGEVTLYHDNSGKLSTSATGIQVTGNIANASGNMTLDAAGEIKLDTVGGIVRILETGGEYGMLQISNSDFIIRSMVSDKDLIFKGNDSGSVITALTLDFSEAGAATFNSTIATGSGGASGKIAIAGNTATSEATHITFTNGAGAKVFAVGGGQSGVTNNGFVIRNVTDNTFPLVISDAGAATFNAGVTANPSGGVVTLGANGHITSKQSLDVTTAGGRYIGSSNRGVVGQIKIEQTATGADGGYIEFDTSSNGSTTPTTRMRIDESGKIQIGNNIPMWSGSYGGALVLKGNNATSDRYAQLAIVNSTGAIVHQGLIVDTSGNLLVGKTAADSGVVGFEARATGETFATAAGAAALYAKRNTNAGDVIVVQGASGTIGSIGVSAFNGLQLGSASGTGFRFDTNDIMPMKSGSAIDATVSLGYPTVRFKDLYLSGNANVADRLLVNGATSNAQLSVKGDASLRAQNVQVAVDGHTAIGFFNTAGTDVGGIAIGTNGASISLGGNSASNTLDDYEEGTWTPTFRDLNGNLATLSTALGSYTKIGRQVILNFNLTLSSKGSMTGDFCLMSNLPFSHPNNAYNGTGHIDKFTNLDTAVSGLSFDISSTTTLMWLMGVAAAGSGSSQYISTSYIGGNEQFKGTCIYYTDD